MKINTKRLWSTNLKSFTVIQILLMLIYYYIICLINVLQILSFFLFLYSTNAENGANGVQQCIGDEKVPEESRMYGSGHACVRVSRCTGIVVWNFTYYIHFTINLTCLRLLLLTYIFNTLEFSFRRSCSTKRVL